MKQELNGCMLSILVLVCFFNLGGSGGFYFWAGPLIDAPFVTDIDRFMSSNLGALAPLGTFLVFILWIVFLPAMLWLSYLITYFSGQYIMAMINHKQQLGVDPEIFKGYENKIYGMLAILIYIILCVLNFLIPTWKWILLYIKQ